MNRWQGCWLPFVKQRRGGVAGLGDRRGMTTEKKSISTISLSLRWCVVAAAAAARRGNQVFVHLARVFLGAIYSCRRKAAATPQLPLILVWVVYLYVCVCAGRPADLICFFPLLGTFEIHPTASSCIYIHPSGGSSASLLLSKGFSLPSRQYRSQYTPARRSHWGWVFYWGVFFWRRGGAFVVGDIVLTQRYELEKGQTLKNGRVHRETQQQRRLRCFPLFLVKDGLFKASFDDVSCLLIGWPPVVVERDEAPSLHFAHLPFIGSDLGSSFVIGSNRRLEAGTYTFCRLNGIIGKNLVHWLLLFCLVCINR